MPSGWYTDGAGCYINSAAAVNADSRVTAKGLANVKLEGSAFSDGNGEDDTAVLVDGTTATEASDADRMLDISSLWNTTEFGVFGDGGGGEAYFASGSDLTTQTTLSGGETFAPDWVQMNSPYATVSSNSTATVSVGCPSGTEVLGGGSFISGGSPQVMVGLTSSLSSLTGWETKENDNSGSSESVEAWGICAHALPERSPASPVQELTPQTR
jgi:hypothetical protein